MARPDHISEKAELSVMQYESDYAALHHNIERMELGIRALCIMYDEHSDDKSSHEHAFRHRNNIYFRLKAARFHHSQILQQINVQHANLNDINKTSPEKIFNIYPISPILSNMENEISFLFDSVVFTLFSVFDYVSHITTYIALSNGAKTFYWPELIKSAKGKKRDLRSTELASLILRLNDDFVHPLYLYRSRLLHNEMDTHGLKLFRRLSDNTLSLSYHSSEYSLSRFKNLRSQYEHKGPVTLPCLSSWLIHQTLQVMDLLISELARVIKAESHWHKNIVLPKKPNGLMFAIYDKSTNTARPASDGLWEQYKHTPYRPLEVRSI